MNNKKQILIAEDEKPMNKALQMKLDKAGFVVKGVINGEEALAELQANKYDLLLLDLMMPKVDGFEVLEQIKKKAIKTPVFVTTNLGQEEDRKKAEAMGAKDYLVKSNTPISDIVSRVKKFLGVK